MILTNIYPWPGGARTPRAVADTHPRGADPSEPNRCAQGFHPASP